MGPSYARLLAILAGLAAVGVGALIPVLAAQPSRLPVLITAMAFVLAVPIVVRGVQRKLDVLEPVMFFVAVWALMFIARPLAMRGIGDTWLRRAYNVEGGMTAALTVGLIGAVAFLVGYWVADRWRPTSQDWDRRGPPPRWIVASTAIAGLGAMAALRGTTFLEVTATGVGAYIYLAPLLTIPAQLLLWHLGYPRIAFVTLAVSVAGFLLLGQRAFVIWPVSAALVYWYMSRGRRPRSLVIAGIIVFGLFPLFTVLEVAREKEVSPFAAILERDTIDPASALARFTQGDTTSMFAALSLQMMTEGQVWDREPGRWAYSTATRWIPSKLWAGKPIGSSEYLSSLYFPRNRKQGATVFTLVSEFYFDLGVPGVILGMAGVGWVLGRVWRWARTGLSDPWMWIFYAPLFGLATIMFRGDVGLTFGLAVFVYGPLLVARSLARPLLPSAS